jgi:ABC-type Na+ efflux pump permease subunit
MILAIILIIFIIVLISALLYILGRLVAKRMISRRKKYQDHIDSMVEELFPPSIPAAIQDYSAIDTTVLDTTVLDTTVQEAAVIESDLQYQETKRKMVADIKRYFNQRKIDATLAKVQGSSDFVKINPSAGSYSEQIIPTPPSIQMLLE